MAVGQVQEVAQQECQCDYCRTVNGSSRPGRLVWRRRCTTVPHEVWVLVFAVAAEFGWANAAMERYEQPTLAMHTRDDRDAPARRVYVEFYADQ